MGFRVCWDSSRCRRELFPFVSPAMAPTASQVVVISLPIVIVVIVRGTITVIVIIIVTVVIIIVTAIIRH